MQNFDLRTISSTIVSHIFLTKLTATVSSANWKIGDQNYYRYFAKLSWKNQEFTKSSSAIWSAANWATKISSAAQLLIAHRHQYCIRDGE